MQHSFSDFSKGSDITDPKYIVALVGVICVTAVLCMALYKGIDGTLLSGGLAILGGIVGYCFKAVNVKAKTD